MEKFRGDFRSFMYVAVWQGSRVMQGGTKTTMKWGCARKEKKETWKSKEEGNAEREGDGQQMSLSRSEPGEILPHHISLASASSYYSLDGIKRPLTVHTSAHLVHNARPRGTHATRQPDAQHAHLPVCLHTAQRLCWDLLPLHFNGTNATDATKP